MNRKFYKTLKFKFTLWYSLLLSIFCITFVFSIDLWLGKYMNQAITDNKPNIFFDQRPRRRSLSPELREEIHASRMHDLENIQQITRHSLIPLISLSLLGGYFLSTILLKPLEELNRKISQKRIGNLNKEIPFIDKGDEISEVTKSFNIMSKRLSQAFESQKQFVENASHEIKTPLSIIQANLDTILDKKNISQKELSKLLKNAKEQIAFMDNLTEDLFLLSHVSSNLNIQMKKLNANDFIEKIILGFKNNTEEKSMQIIFKKQDIDANIFANSLLLERAFSNIISNAIKYSGAKEITILLEKKTENIVFKISDNGKGIPSQHQKKIFDRFYRIDKGRSRKEGGNGLGLAITKEIIEKHSGKISLDTTYKKGTRFIIQMPIDYFPIPCYTAASV